MTLEKVIEKVKVTYLTGTYESQNKMISLDWSDYAQEGRAGHRVAQVSRQSRVLTDSLSIA